MVPRCFLGTNEYIHLSLKCKFDPHRKNLNTFGTLFAGKGSMDQKFCDGG